MDRTAFFAEKGFFIDGPDLPLDVSHLWHGCVVGAIVSDFGRISAGGARRGVYALYFFGRIWFRLGIAKAGRCLSMGLQQKQISHTWADTLGLCPCMVWSRIIF